MNYSKTYILQAREAFKNPPFSVEFLAKHGKTWDKADFLQCGEKRMCYNNAASLAVSENWYYAEGYACPKKLKLPLMHAWCVRPDGSIVDPTWEDGTDYFGAVFVPRFVYEWMVECGYAGIFENLFIMCRKFDDLTAHLETGLVSICP